MLEIIDHGAIREIRLMRPPVNALNPEFVGLQTQALQEATACSDAIVLSGSPGIFSAGLDVVELLPFGRSQMRDFWQAFFDMLQTIACSPVPVAAAITGHAPAGGAVISLMTDYRVMSRGRYKIGLNETRVGLVIPRLLQDAMATLVGPRAAEKMIVAGALVPPDEALQIGLVDALEDDHETVIGHAVQWCEDLLALPRRAMLGNRAIARARYQRVFELHRDEGVEAITNGWFSEETQTELNTLVAHLKGRQG
jgi:enoyl-CoA hydratase/carnithine racemase